MSGNILFSMSYQGVNDRDSGGITNGKANNLLLRWWCVYKSLGVYACVLWNCGFQETNFKSAGKANALKRGIDDSRIFSGEISPIFS